MGERGMGSSFTMISIKRRLLVVLGSRTVRSLTHHPVLLLLLCVLLTASCVIHFSSRSGPELPTLPADLKKEIVLIEAPAQPQGSGKQNDLSVPSDKLQSIFEPPLPVVDKRQIIKKQRKQYEDYEEELEPQPESLMEKMLGYADKMREEGPTIVESVLSVAKGIKSMSDKVAKVNKKMESKKLKYVQGFVNSEEEKNINGDSAAIPDPPLGPEARQNSEFEKQMQYSDKKPSLLKSIAKNVGPALLSGVAKSAAREDSDGGGGGGFGGPSLMENIFVNLGPKIIADAFGGSGSGGRQDGDNSGVEGGSSSGGFMQGLKLIAPLVQSVVKSQQGDKDGSGGGNNGLLQNLLKPIVKSVVQSQQGDKENVDTAVSSILGVVGGLAPLLQGGGGDSGGESPMQDTLAALKPLLSAMGPSIMERIIESKQNSKRARRNMEVNSAEAGHLGNSGAQPPVTIIDKMLHGRDEKTVGQAVGRALSSVMVRALPETLPLPEPSAIRHPYDMALNLVMGNPRNNSKGVWPWLRKMSGEPDGGLLEAPAPWVAKFLTSPKRATFKEDIRHFYGLLENLEPGCRNIRVVGGMYDWRKDNIVGSRRVCEDFDLWKAPVRRVLSFGIRDGWTFEEELAQRKNCQVHVLDAELGLKDHNHTENIVYHRGRLEVEKSGENDTKEKHAYETLPFSAWLQRWQLQQTPLHLVKLDVGGGEWQILRSILDKDSQSLEEVLQLLVTIHMDEALRDARLYSFYIDTLDLLTSLGFQLFNVSAVTGEGQLYHEPMLDSRQVALQYQLAFVRT